MMPLHRSESNLDEKLNFPARQDRIRLAHGACEGMVRDWGVFQPQTERFQLYVCTSGRQQQEEGFSAVAAIRLPRMMLSINVDHTHHTTAEQSTLRIHICSAYKTGSALLEKTTYLFHSANCQIHN